MMLRLARPGRRLLFAAGGITGACLSAQLVGFGNPVALCDSEEALPVGGVLAEFRKPQRRITRLQEPIEGFFHKEILTLGVPIRAHKDVSDAALVVVARVTSNA